MRYSLLAPLPLSRYWHTIVCKKKLQAILFVDDGNETFRPLQNYDKLTDRQAGSWGSFTSNKVKALGCYVNTLIRYYKYVILSP